jgi:hypothetical protein
MSSVLESKASDLIKVRRTSISVGFSLRAAEWNTRYLIVMLANQTSF